MNSKLTPSLVAGFALLFSSPAVHAADTDIEQLQEQIKQVVEQNQQLTMKLADMEAKLQAMQSNQKVETEATASEEASESDSGLLTKINQHVSLSGAIEVEMGWSEDFEGGEESDITLATAEIALETQITEWDSGLLALEWDDEEDKITIDEAFITLGNTDKFPLFVQVGRYVTPFGLYDGNTIADPLTKEAFETKEDALLVGAEVAGFQGSLFIFNGDTNEGGGNDHIGQWGINLGYGMEHNGMEVTANLGYVNSVMDADGLTGILEDLQSEADASGAFYDPDDSFLTADNTGGIAFNAGIRVANFVFLGEYITAVEDFTTRTFLMGTRSILDIQPSAYHLEVGYSFTIGDYPALVSAAYSGTDDLMGLLPESRLALDFGIELFEGTSLTFEYAHDEDYDVADGGTGESADSFTTQAAYEF